MKFIFKYPTRGRPDWFKDTLSAYYSKLSGLHQYKFIIAMDNDDAKMNNRPMENWLSVQKDLEYFYAGHANKIQACNSGVPDDDWDILVLVSDDMTPLVHAFDNIIANDMKQQFPEMDGALHYWDGRCPGTKELITFSIIGRKLYDRIGFVYWPSYQGVWCDNEFTDIVKMWNKYWYSDNTIVRHDWRTRTVDEVYEKGESKGQEDNQAYIWRKKRGFPVSYSQNKEDWIIRKYFKDKYDGRFLDIGAADGVAFSNTKLLYDMGWNGVAVEPSENHCVAMKEHVPRTIVEMAALTYKDGPVELWHTPDCTSTLNEEHKRKWENTTTYTKRGVDGICWKTLMTKRGYDFDFINIDIEGENIPMLQLMPHEYKERAKMICIEHDGKISVVLNELEQYGFKMVHTNGENVILAK